MNFGIPTVLIFEFMYFDNNDDSLINEKINNNKYANPNKNKSIFLTILGL